MDGYIADDKQGKKLEDDQRAAIAKYAEVVQSLDLARELSGQFKQLATDEEKARKKQAKKDGQERAKAEVRKVAAVLEIQVRSQPILVSLGGTPSVTTRVVVSDGVAIRVALTFTKFTQAILVGLVSACKPVYLVDSLERERERDVFQLCSAGAG